VVYFLGKNNHQYTPKTEKTEARSVVERDLPDLAFSSQDQQASDWFNSGGIEITSKKSANRLRKQPSSTSRKRRNSASQVQNG